MAGASKPSSAAAVADKKNGKSHDPSPPIITPTNTKNGGNRFSALNVLLFIVPLLLGMAIGVYLTAYLLESEYREFLIFCARVAIIYISNFDIFIC